MYVVIDVETTGLPPKGVTYDNLTAYNGARVWQIAWASVDPITQQVKQGVSLINDTFTFGPDYPFVPPKRDDLLQGQPISIILTALQATLTEDTILVGHNIAFDLGVIQSEVYRCWGVAGLPFIKQLGALPRCCTMQLSTNVLKLPSEYGYKYPRLTELHQYCLGCGFTAHDALEDVMATLRCFLYMSLRGWPDVPSIHIACPDVIIG